MKGFVEFTEGSQPQDIEQQRLDAEFQRQAAGEGVYTEEGQHRLLTRELIDVHLDVDHVQIVLGVGPRT
jgi:hypothetical protein